MRIIHNIQFLRTVAALLLMIFHFGIFLPGLEWPRAVIDYAQFGVDLFFIISGFIIYLTTANRHSQDIKSFWRRRLSKVYFNYWLVLLASLPIIYRYTSWKDMPFNEEHITGFALNFLPIPQQGPLLLIQSWSLSFEIYFYLIFGLSLFVQTKYRLFLMLAILVAVRFITFIIYESLEIAPSSGYVETALQSLSSSIIFEFIGGIILALLFERGWFGSHAALVCTACPLLTGAALAPLFTINNRLLHFGVFALGIAAAALYLEATARQARWQISHIGG